MKVKLNLEIHMDIPGEFQDDFLAVKIIQDEINERLDIGYQYEKEDQPELMFLSSKIIKYIPGKGKL